MASTKVTDLQVDVNKVEAKLALAKAKKDKVVADEKKAFDEFGS